MALTFALAVRAEGPLQVAFEYDAPDAAGCPNEPDFRAAVTGLLDYDPFVPTAARTLSVEISARDGALDGLLSWRNQAGAVEGERRLTSSDADCAKLAQNLAFAIAVQLQLQRAPGEDAAQPETPAAERDAVRAEPEPEPTLPAPTRGPTRSRPLEIGAGVGPFVVFGWSPEAVAGGNLVLLGRGRSFGIQLAFEVSFPNDSERDDGSGFETWVLASSLAPCVRFGALAACPLLRVGQFRVQGFGVDEPHSAQGLLAEAGLRLEVGQALGAGLEGRAHAEAVGTLSSRTVQLNGNEVFSAPPVVFLVGVDLVAFFL